MVYIQRHTHTVHHTNLGNAPILNEEQLVEQVGVSIVQSYAQRSVEHALAGGHEGCLLQSHVVSKRRDTVNEGWGEIDEGVKLMIYHIFFKSG
jgi:hypothetical protein